MDHIRFQLATGSVWITTAQACEHINVSRQALKQLIDRGVMRARRQDDRKNYIFRDDVFYVYQQRQQAHDDNNQRASYETLVERGIFPESLETANGFDLTTWAQNNQSELLRSRLAIPPTLPSLNEAGEKVDEPVTLALLARRLLRAEQALNTVLAGQSINPILSKLSPTDIASIIRRTKAALRLGLHSAQDITSLCQLYLRLDAHHMTQISQFPVTHPDMAAEVLEGGEVAYQSLYRIGDYLIAAASQLPGAGLKGSVHNRTLDIARQVKKILSKLCSNQAGIDFLLRQDAGHYLPVPLTEIDRYILNQVTG